MTIALIAALSRNYVIGKNNSMPWHLPADLKRFKALTLGKPVIMGRKTYQSIGKALPNRQNIIITHNRHFTAPDGHIAYSLEEALALAPLNKEVMIIGGAHLFAQTMPLAKRMYLTIIQVELEGDTYFPSWDPNQWRIIEQQEYPADEKNPYNLQFLTLER